MKKIYWLAFIYIVSGLALGVFYREFTVFQDYQGPTQLSVLHTHTLVLGGFFFLIVIMIDYSFKISQSKSFTYWIITYNVGLIGVLITMLIRGTIQVLSTDVSGLNHIAGLFHTIMGVAFIWFLLLLRKALFSNQQALD